MKKMPKVFLFACGGTGGHIFPALSVGEELGRRGQARILYICGKKEIENAIFGFQNAPEVISMEVLPYQGLKSLIRPFFWLCLVRSFFQSVKLIRRERPALVVGFGGYVSFPVIAAAKCLSVPALIHEQNVLPGKANRVLAPYVDGIAASFPETPEWLKGKKTRVTGNPIRSIIERDCREEAVRFFGFEPQKKTLLVLGGSQGAESINTFFLNSLKVMTSLQKNNLQVLHLCGRMRPEDAEQACREHGVFARAFSFFNRMDLAYAAADFCVGRAGATFLAEVKTRSIPVLLVPYPFGDGHQRANAKVYQKLIGARVCEQKELNAEKLAEILGEMMREISTSSLRPQVGPNARIALAEFIEECSSS